MRFSKPIILASSFCLLWWVYTAVHYNAVLYAYATTNLPIALLTTDSIFFGAIIVLISVLISMSGTAESYKRVIIITKPMRSLSVAVAILLMANLSSYFTS